MAVFQASVRNVIGLGYYLLDSNIDFMLRDGNFVVTVPRFGNDRSRRCGDSAI